jgi:hypothetical protein
MEKGLHKMRDNKRIANQQVVVAEQLKKTQETKEKKSTKSENIITPKRYTTQEA